MAVYLRVRLRRTQIQQNRFVRLAEQVLRATDEAASELSIELIGDHRMRRLNRVYRGKDRTTDVLAFPMREARPLRASPRTGDMLGDVVISVPTALRQAREVGRTPEEEMAALLVHGILHLCGYDHERNEQEAARMRRREETVLRTIRPVPRLLVSRVEQGKRSR
jgi:rRNA maturation RNase YbeY